MALEHEPRRGRVFIIAQRRHVMAAPAPSSTAGASGGGAPPAAGRHETPLSIDKARRVLGYEPKHSWKDHV